MRKSLYLWDTKNVRSIQRDQCMAIIDLTTFIYKSENHNITQLTMYLFNMLIVSQMYFWMNYYIFV